MLKIISIFGICVLPLVSEATPEYAQTDRYTLVRVEARADQKDPLTTVVTMRFGNDIRSVGDAIGELLKGSGYRWEQQRQNGNDEGAISDSMLHNMPLPAIVRDIGPIRLADALSTVAGSAWQLNVDELHRTVWFSVK